MIKHSLSSVSFPNVSNIFTNWKLSVNSKRLDYISNAFGTYLCVYIIIRREYWHSKKKLD